MGCDDFAALIAEETEADDGVDIDAARDRRMTQLGQHVAPTVDAIDLETLDGIEHPAAFRSAGVHQRGAYTQPPERPHHTPHTAPRHPRQHAVAALTQATSGHLPAHA